MYGLVSWWGWSLNCDTLIAGLEPGINGLPKEYFRCVGRVRFWLNQSHVTLTLFYFLSILFYLCSVPPQILHHIRSVSFLCKKEPPPPRTTPWGAYRWHGNCIHISPSAQQPGEMRNVSAFGLLYLLQS